MELLAAHAEPRIAIDGHQGLGHLVDVIRQLVTGGRSIPMMSTTSSMVRFIVRSSENWI